MSILKANRIENLTTTDGGINVNNSGNVGIGTANPARELSIGDGSGSPNIRTFLQAVQVTQELIW